MGSSRTTMHFSNGVPYKCRAESRASWLYLMSCLLLRACALHGLFRFVFFLYLRGPGDALLSVLSVKGEVAGVPVVQPPANSLLHIATAEEQSAPLEDGLDQSEDPSDSVVTGGAQEESGRPGHKDSLPVPQPGLADKRRLSEGGGFLRWWYRVHNLPRIDEAEFPDELIDSQLDEGDTRSLAFLLNPSPELVDFLQLSDDDAKHGLVVKAKKLSVLSPGDALYEGYIHNVLTTRIAGGNDFFLPQFGTYRSTGSNWLLLFLPFVQGSLRTCMREAPRGFNLKAAAAEMLLAVRDLHAAGYVHRDLKISNFLLGHDGHVYLADMESVIPINSTGDFVGTRGYIPPEIEREHDSAWSFGGMRYNEKTDVYSLGKALYKMYEKLSQRRPLENKSELLALIRKMTEPDPHDRISIAEALEEPYFRGVDFELMRTKSGPRPFLTTEERYDLKKEQQTKTDGEVNSTLPEAKVPREDQATAEKK
ncbi:rhoptry kinase family protein rop35 [Cystoisospora suis]|uniref:Rhoptry kinase family protein rop35 n=1 Tax=Cystoisospora suis TaxID=483139 RepID=A0A2C6KL76_9APIC|nr:rhoptry kinase family protein rop35 [Cystoisospora suis]